MKETNMMFHYDTSDDEEVRDINININKPHIPTDCFGACCKTSACISLIVAYMWLLVLI